MDFPFYKKTLLTPAPKEPVALPPSHPISEIRPETYLPDDGLVDAVNVALLLGQPLLLTGEPGTGKTHLAYHVAWQFGLGEVLKFETKSDSKAQDLFYIYDALQHFPAVQIDKELHQTSSKAKEYFDYTALGKAIILTHEEKELREKDILPDDFEHWAKPKRSVVLIDEIDKAPRDFPNDILNEVEHLHFRIPELGKNNLIDVKNNQLKPILILTSNSEKHLPDAFLRRCIYYNIPFPEPDVLRTIVAKRLELLATTTQSDLLDDALELFGKLRAAISHKKPATAELLNWLMALHERFKGRKSTECIYTDEFSRTLFSTLIKNTDDQKMANLVFNRWLENKKSRQT